MTLRSLDHLTSALLLLAQDALEADGSAGAGAPDVPLAAPFTNMEQADWAEAVRLWNAHGRSAIASLERRPCPACGGADSRPLFESYDGYPYVECNDCGCWHVPLRVEAALFDAFFARCPAARAVADRMFALRATPEYDSATVERMTANLDAVAPLLGGGDAPGRYLDIGCGVGHSLQVAAGRGMQAAGTESSADCLRIARAKGLEVRSAGEPLPAGPFRLVSLWESLEHIADPAALLEACRPLLEPRGLLAFTVPNQLSPLVRLQRGDCSIVHGGYDTPGHINLFGPGNLGRLLGRCGYELLDVDGLYGLNANELAAYAAGLNRGARDLLSGANPAVGLPGPASQALGHIGPAFAVIERMALLSPILYGIACRKESAPGFAEGVARLRRGRRERMLAQVKGMMPPLPEVEALRRELLATRLRLDEVELETATYRALVRALRNPGPALRRLLGGR
jgi:SAM-dependent methyltransferase